MCSVARLPRPPWFCHSLAASPWVCILTSQCLYCFTWKRQVTKTLSGMVRIKWVLQSVQTSARHKGSAMTCCLRLNFHSEVLMKSQIQLNSIFRTQESDARGSWIFTKIVARLSFCLLAGSTQLICFPQVLFVFRGSPLSAAHSQSSQVIGRSTWQPTFQCGFPPSLPKTTWNRLIQPRPLEEVLITPFSHSF